MCHRIHEDSEISKTIADSTRSKEDLPILLAYLDFQVVDETIFEEPTLK